MTQKELGKRIKTFREMRGMTQAEVAADLKLVPQTLSKWERGLSSPSICELPSLCRALGINLSLLLDEDTGHGEYMLDGKTLEAHGFILGEDGRATKTATISPESIVSIEL
jgi:transcriptional regulator with XRE-family HTH domain